MYLVKTNVRGRLYSLGATCKNMTDVGLAPPFGFIIRR